MATIQKRKNKSGGLSFLIKVSLGYDINDKQIIKSMTWKPETSMTIRQAEKEANRQAVLFEDKCKSSNLTNKSVRFQQLANEWLEYVETTQKMKPSTIVRLKTLRERTYKAIGNIYVDNLTYRQIQSFIISLSRDGTNQKTGKGLSQKTQRHYLSFISDVMRYAKKCGLILNNPCVDISTVKTDKKEKDIYSLEELKTLLKRIDSKAATNYKVLFSILGYCGLRRGEVLGLEYKDIDFHSGVVSIVRTSNYQTGLGVYTSTPKTKSSCRKILLQPNILDLIKQLKTEQHAKAIKCGDLWNETDRLFVTWCGKPMHPNTPYTWLKRFCEEENLPFKGLHSFRHTVATQAIIGGQNYKSVSSILGHSQTSTTMNIYAHATQESNMEVFNCIADLINTNVEKTDKTAQ